MITYLKFMKHAEKVAAASSKSRPILAGVLHRDKSLAVTDSHRLYYAAGIAPEGEESVINPKTGDALDSGNYPDVERLIPVKDDSKADFEINIDLAAKVAKLVENAEKINGTERMTILAEGDELIISTAGGLTDVTVKAAIGKRTDGSTYDFKMYTNPKYVAEAFAMLKDSKENAATFRFYGEVRPFTIATGEDLTALILPIRLQ